MTRYGHGTPDDWMERNVYTPLNKWGIVILALVDIALFGLLPGALIFGVQMAWIPFWAAGVINGIGHWWGYRNFVTEDASTNITPIAAWIGGEELHNNHHAYPTSAKFSIRWYEFDLGWLYIRTLSALGLATVRKTAPNFTLDVQMLDLYPAVTISELNTSTRRATIGFGLNAAVTTGWIMGQSYGNDATKGSADGYGDCYQPSQTSCMLKTTWKMRQELTRLWERSTLNTEQLVNQLKDWCERAEKSDVPALVAFSRRLRCYA